MSDVRVLEKDFAVKFDVLDLAKELIRRPSLTPVDAGCQDLIIERLKPFNFLIERPDFEDVRNLWAKRGNTAPLLVFVGHTDVVPTGPECEWKSAPFEPTERDGY